MTFRTLKTSKYCLRVLCLLLSTTLTASCTKALVKEPTLSEPVVRAFFESFDKVWIAIQKTMGKYPPPAINKIDEGILETTFIKGDKFFADPTEERPTTGHRYKLIIRAVKGSLEGRPAVKVTVLKTTEVQRDFFSGFVNVPSNGLEETAVLYRISRQLELDRAVTSQSK